MTSTTLAPAPAPTAEASAAARRRPTVTAVLTWIVAGVFAATLLAVLVSVIVTSLGTSWGGSWLPDGFTWSWFRQAWDTPGLAQSIEVTFEVAIVDVLVALAIGVPAGYVLARKKFPGRNAILLFALLPVILPSLTYAVQLAALMYRLGSAAPCCR